MSPPMFSDLDAQGLNLQAVFNVAELPADVRQRLPDEGRAGWRQLLLIGHRGRLLWQQVQREQLVGTDPIDRFTRTQVDAWLQRHQPGVRHVWVYPGANAIDLQGLGQLAGWHHPSPFMVGIHPDWGSWFAYRAVVLADTDLPVTPPLKSASPCAHCASRVCVAACPADALRAGFDLVACVAYRLTPDSSCRERCLARNACPVGEDQRYSDAQTAYHYRQSLAALKAWRPS